MLVTVVALHSILQRLLGEDTVVEMWLLKPQEWWNVDICPNMPLGEKKPHCYHTVKSQMFSYRSSRHARPSISPGWGGLPLQPVSGGRGSEPQGCSAFRESAGHADGHHIQTLPPWVWFCLWSLFRFLFSHLFSLINFLKTKPFAIQNLFYCHVLISFFDTSVTLI